MDAYLVELNSILSNLFAKYRTDRSVPGVLLSGGIDSSTVTMLISRNFPVYHIFSMGTGDSKDREFVSLMAARLRRDFHWVHLDEGEIKDSVPRVVELLKEAGVPQTPMQVALATGYFLIFREAARKGITRIFTGQGPDITFGGYHKYKSIPDVAAQIKKDLPLLEVDKRRDGAMAAHHGITLTNPYLEPEMMAFALRVPPEFKIANGVEKFLLRRYAESIGVPSQIVKRPKKAFQYSTGLQKVINKIYSAK